MKIAFPSVYFLTRRMKGDASNWTSPITPWVNDETKKWLDEHVKKGNIVFEYGSGGSTLYFADRATKVFSVEHKINWYMRLRKKTREMGLHNCEIYFAEAAMGSRDGFMSTEGSLSGVNFKEYVEKIFAFPDRYFDIVFVDGRARSACIKASLPKVKNGGYIVLDNSERPGYQPAFELLKGYPRETYSGPVTGTPEICSTTVWHIIHKL